MQLNLIDFKPHRDGVQLDSPFIQAAIDELASVGGGTLYIPSGQYKIGAIILKSNINLHLEAGARLIASDHYEDFSSAESVVAAEQSWHSVLFARDAENISITGQGTLFGNADAYHASEADDLGYRMPALHRPRMIIFENCRNVRLNDFRIEHAPMWTVHLVSCVDVFIQQLTIANALHLTNTDAIDLDSCRNVHISNCSISAADDCICVKTSKMPDHLARPAENMTITNCNLVSKSCAIKVGTETFRDVRNMTVSNCIITNTNRAIGLVSRDGGQLSNIIFKNIIIESAQTSVCHWGKADPVYISIRYRHPEVKPGKIRNVMISDIIAESEGAINFHGEEGVEVENVSINNVQLTLKPSQASDRGCFDVRPPCNPANPTGVGLDNAFSMNSETGKPFGVAPYPGGMPALFASRVKGLKVSNLQVSREGDTDYWHSEDIVEA